MSPRARCIRLLLVVAVAIVPGAGCGEKRGDRPARRAAPTRTVDCRSIHAPKRCKIDAAADGATILMSPGGRLILALDEESDSGYTWKTTVKPDPAIVHGRRVNIDPVAHHDRTRPPPAGGTAHVGYLYVAGQRGRTRVVMVERRSFEPLSAEIGRISFTIAVR